jgi:uncharacterized delta-60 repeat protein
MRKLLLVLVVLGLCGSVGARKAKAQFDPTFGQNGIVAVDLPGGLRAMGAAPDGSSYVLTENWNCASECEVSGSLYRYTPEGEPDQGFAGPRGFFSLALSRENRLGLTVDSQGLPLLIETGKEDVLLRRLTVSGAPDPSFGSAGVVDLRCDCLQLPMQVIPAAAGGLMMVTSSSSTMAVLRVVRLQADGSPDPRFGKLGTATLGLRDAEPFTAAAASRPGALYLAGPVCCHTATPLYLARISAKGKLDTYFLSAARHSLNSIARLQHYGTKIAAVLPRPGGKIDLLGYTGGHRSGFVVRLNPDGRRHRAFGRHGLQILPYPILSATLGSDGTDLAVSDANVAGGGSVLRILPDGRIDAAFVPRRISGSSGDTGLSIVGLPGRRALLFDLGLHECRYSPCEKDPKLIRYLEPAPSR